MNLEKLTTERRNEETFGLDEMSVSTALEKMNKEDKKVAEAVEKALPMIEPVIEKTIESFNQGGRGQADVWAYLMLQSVSRRLELRLVWLWVSLLEARKL